MDHTMPPDTPEHPEATRATLDQLSDRLSDEAVRAALHALIADLSDETTATLLAVVRAWLTGPREPGGC